MANLATINNNILADSGIDPISVVTGSGSVGQVAFWSGANTQTGSVNLFWDSVNNRLGIKNASPTYTLSINGGMSLTNDGGIGILWQNGAAFRSSGTIYFDYGQGGSGDIYFRGGSSLVTTATFYNNNNINLAVSGGSVGITQPTPVTKLDVNGAMAVAGPLAAHTTARGVLEYNGDKVALRAYGATAGTGYIAFNTGGGGGTADSEKMRLTPTGNLLVGSSADTTERLQITGTSKFTDSATFSKVYTNTSDLGVIISATIPGINLRTASSGRISLISNYNSANSASIVTGTGTNNPTALQMFFDFTNLRVGIGTPTPNTKLDVLGAASVAGGTDGLRIGNVGDNSSYDNVKIYYTGYNAGAPRVYLTPRTTPGSGVVETYFHLQNTNGSSVLSNNTMGLLVDGSVGIGNTAPTQKLHVTGNIRVTGAYYDSNNSAGTVGQVLSATATGTDWVSLSEITGVDGTGTANYIAKWLDANTITDSLLQEGANAIGLGITPSAWAVLRGFQVGLTASIGGYISATEGAFFSSNSFYNGGAFVYQVNGSATQYLQINGQHRWSTAISGTAGANISFTQAMTLDANGRLLLGTTSASANGLLQVNGDLGFQGSRTVRIASNSDGETLTYLGTRLAISNVNSFTYGYADASLIASVANSDNLLLIDSGRYSGATISRFRVSNTTLGDTSFSLTRGASTTFFASTLGNVGVGTSSPLHPLDVTSAGNTILYIRAGSATSLSRLVFGTSANTDRGFIDYDNTTAARYMSFKIAEVEAMRIINNRNVGIGTSAPSSLLHISGAAATLQITDTAKTAVNTLSIYALSQTSWAIATGTAGTLGTQRITITDDGFIGLGTTTPTSRLYVTLPGINTTFDSGTAADARLEFRRAGVRIGYLNWDSGVVTLQADSGNYLSFNAGGSERVRITAAGDVGIGTSAPNVKLDVNGTLDLRNAFQGYARFAPSAGNGSQARLTIRLKPVDTAEVVMASLVQDGSVGLGGNITDIISMAGSFLSIASNGQIRLRNYGVGTFTGTVAYNLAVDANGNVIETAGGVVDGSGTANYVSKWQDANTLTNSLLFDNGTNVGIGGSPIDMFFVSSATGGTLAITSGYQAGSLATPIYPTLNFRGYANEIKGQIRSWDVSQNLVNGVLIFSVMNTSGVLTETMRITADGRLGIGTTAPQTALDVTGAIRVSGTGGTGFFNGSNAIFETPIAWGNIGGSAFQIRNTTSLGLVFGASTSQLMTLTTGGNLGISTTAPTAKLHVAGDGRFGSYIYLGSEGAGGVIGDLGTANYLRFLVSNAEAMRILSSGNIGIGNTSPQAQLQIGAKLGTGLNVYSFTGYKLGVENGTSRFIGPEITASNQSTVIADFLLGVSAAWQNPTGLLTFTGRDRGNNVDSGVLGYIGITKTTAANAVGSGNLIFGTAAASSLTSTERMRISATGDVGIGTSAPGAKLEVSGTSSLSTAIFTNTATDGGIDIRNTGTLAAIRSAQIRLTNGTTFFGANDRTYQLVNLGTGATTAAFTIQYWDGANYFERMRIRDDGNFGIGNSNPTQALVVQRNQNATTQILVQNSDVTNSSSRASVAALSGTVAVRMDAIGAITPGGYLGTTSNHPLYFWSNATERMVITTAGDVGIGTTAPAAMLNVAGSVQVGTSSTTSMSFRLTRANSGFTADAHYFTAVANTPVQSWIEGGYMTGERTGVITAPNSGYPYYEEYIGNGGATAKAFGFVNKTSGSFISTDILYAMYIKRTGQMQFAKYGIGTFTGTVAYNLAVDALGNVIETAGGVVDGSGTANYISKWQDANTLTNSLLFDNGTTLLLGSTTSVSNPIIGAGQLQIHSTSYGSFNIYGTANSTDGSYIGLFKSRGTSIVNNGDELGGIYFGGYNGSAYNAAASIMVIVDGAPGVSDMPGALLFRTTADGASASTERMRINSSGNLLIGSTADTGAGQRLQVTGNAYLSGNLSVLNGFTISSAGSNNLTGAQSTQAAAILRITNSISSFRLTAGTQSMVDIVNTFAPTSGPALHHLLNLEFTVNQTGGASGITRGIFLNAIITAAADFRAIEWTNNTGWGLYGAGTAPSYFGGDLLIGTTTEAYRQGNRAVISLTGVTDALMSFRASGTSIGYIYATTASLDINANSRPITFSTTGSQRATILNNGNFGINTSTPATTLNVNGIIRGESSTWEGSIISNSNGTSYSSFGWYQNATKRWSFYNDDNGSNALNLANQSGTVSMTFLQGGAVGIGITAPTAKLHLQGEMKIGGDNGAANTRLTRINFVRSVYDPTGVGASIDFYREGSGSEGALAFSTNPGVSGDNAVERMRINASGNVGIGTTAPISKLDVIGNTYVSGRLSVATTSTAGTGLTVGGSTVLLSYAELQGGSVLYFYSSGNTSYSTLAQSGNNFIIAPSANVGIGTGSPATKLEVFDSVTTQLRVRMSGQADMRIISDTGYGAISNDSSMPLVLRTNATERMRITATGDVGIGTTAPAYKLNIVGTLGVGGDADAPFGATISNANLGTSARTRLTLDTQGGTWHIDNQRIGGVLSFTRVSTEYFSLNNVGALRLNAYGTGARTGTVAYNLAVDASGNVIETAGGVVDGSGTANYVSKWQDANTLTNSIIFDNGSAVGIGTATPSGLFEVSGAGVSYFTRGTKSILLNPNVVGQDTNALIEVTSGMDLAFGTGGLERLRITNAGNVGIGTSAPTTSLVVRGNTSGYNKNIVVWERAVDGAVQGTLGFGKPVVAGDENNIFVGSITNHPLLLLTNNLERLRITDAGAVGIGTTAPTSKLHVIGDGLFTNSSTETIFEVSSTWSNSYLNLTRADNSSIAYIRFRTGATNNWQIGTPIGGTYLWFLEGGIERFRISNGGSAAFSSSVTASNFNLTDAGGGAINNQTGNLFLQTVAGGSWIFRNGSPGFAEFMRLDSSGNLAIGTSTVNGYWPSNLTTNNAKIGVYYDDSSTSLNNANAGLVILNTNTTAGTSSKLVFGAYNSDPVAVSLAYISATNALRSSGYMAASLVFATASANGSPTGPTEKMRLTAEGYLGINTIAPTALLHISATASADIIALNYPTLGKVAGIYLDSAAAYYGAGATNTTNAFLAHHTSNVLSFRTGATERMRIDASGNVGIGTSAPAYRLHVLDSANFGTIAIGNVTFPTLLTSNASTGEFRIDNRSSNSVGYISFFPAGQATSAGTEAMRIATNGNVGIGTTSPANKLSVIGGLVTAGTTTTQTAFLGADGSNVAYVGSLTNHPFQLRVNATTRMTITTAGLVGIGTTAPAYLLDVAGAGRFDGTQRIINSNSLRLTKLSIDSIYFADIWMSSTDSLQISSVTNSIKIGGGSPAGFTEYMGIASGGATTFISSVTATSFNGATNNIFSIGGTERMRLSTNGNLGIGTSTPDTTFSTIAKGIVINSGATGNSYLNFQNSTTGTAFADGGTVGINSSNELFLWNNEAAILSFGTGGTEKARISSDGRLMVGTQTNSTFKFDVNGTGRFQDSLTVIRAQNATTAINVINTNVGTDSFSGVQLGSDIAGGTAYTSLVYGTSGVTTNGAFRPNGTTLANYGAGGLNLFAQSQPIRFFTGSGTGSQRLTILDDGKVGIGTSSPNSNFEVSGSVSKSITTKTAAYTLTDLDYTVIGNTNLSGFTFTLPTAVGRTGRIYVIKNAVGGNTLTVDGNASETIDGYLTYILSCQSGIIIQSDGANWHVIADINDTSCFVPN